MSSVAKRVLLPQTQQALQHADKYPYIMTPDPAIQVEHRWPNLPKDAPPEACMTLVVDPIFTKHVRFLDSFH